MKAMWKETFLAGIATIGGLFLITKKPVVKNAEMISFAAPRKFPKKVRLEPYAKIKSDPLNSIFNVEEGYYFARQAYYNSETSLITYGPNNEIPSLEWGSLSAKYVDDVMWEKGFFESDGSSTVYDLVMGHLANLGTPLDTASPPPPYGYNYIECTSRVDGSKYSSAKQMVSDKMTKNMLSRQEFEDRWKANRGWGANQIAMDRLDAYWNLYEKGIVDEKMNDEDTSGIYGEIGSFFVEIIKDTYTINPNYLAGETERFEKLRDRMADLVMDGNDPLRGWKSSNVDVIINKEVYEPTLEEVKVMVEWFMLRETLFWYQAWEQNIQPLIAKGWNPDEGAIVQNIRTSWDAYRDANDTPNRYDKYITGFSSTSDNDLFFSKAFVLKRILKKRHIFNQAIAEDVKRCKNALSSGQNKISLDASQKIRDGLLTTPPFTNLDYFNNFINYDYYYDDFFMELNKLVKQARNNITDAERNAVKQKATELIDYKENKLKEQVKINYDEAVQEAQNNYDNALNELPQQRKSMEEEKDNRLEF